MKLYFGYHQNQPPNLIGELPLMLALLVSACGFFWMESYFNLLPRTAILSILPWLFAFLLSGFFIPWQSRRAFSSAFTKAQTRDRLFKIYGWSVVLATGYLSYRSLSNTLASLFNGGALESIVMPCAFFAALAVALLMGVLLHSLPNWLHSARLAGRLAAEPARETLSLAGGWIAVILLLACYQSLIVQTTSLPSYLSVSPENLCRLLLASLVSSAAFAGVNCWLTPVVPLTISLHWPKTGQPMLSLSRDTSIAATYWLVFDRPLQRKTDGPLIDKAVSFFKDAPLVVVAPSGGDLFGEHLYLADRQGRMKALFPRLEIELDDWKRLLPPAECRAALEYREIYPVEGLLVEAVTTLRNTQDRVVLVNGINLERWRGLLVDATTCVLVFDANSNEIPERIAGYRTLTVRGNKIPEFDFEAIKPSYRPVVFISYANIYRDYAQRLTNVLKQDCEVLSDLELQAGDQWKLKLAEMLESADAVIALAGDATAGRPYPMEEMHRTINLGKLLVPVFVNRFIEPKELFDFFCANTDDTGRIIYLSDCPGKELDRVIALTAANIIKALARIQTAKHAESVIPQDELPELGIRVQIVLAREYGISRREAERWIDAGRIKVNGSVAQLGARLISGDQLQVDGGIVDWEKVDEQNTWVLLYHKPAGELVTHQDPENRPVIFSNLPKLEKGQWNSVMRLDMNTSGIVLVTNDGELANQLMQSAKQIEREFIVRVKREISEAILEQLKQGVKLDDGMTRFDEIYFIAGKRINKWYRIIIKEGGNSSVRDLLASQQIQVSRSTLVRYGPIKLPGSLKAQYYHKLNDKELELLCQLVGYKKRNGVGFANHTPFGQ